MKKILIFSSAVFLFTAGTVFAQEQQEQQEQDFVPAEIAEEAPQKPAEQLPPPPLPPPAQAERQSPPTVAQQPATSRQQQPMQQATQPQDANKISLDVKGMDIIDVLKMISSRSGMNLVIGKNVTGRITLFLKNVDIKDAFEIILLSNDLACERKGGITNIMTQRDYELLYGERYLDTKSAKIIQVKYAKASDLSRALGQIKSNVGKVIVDEGSNMLIIVDSPQKVKDMEDFIKSADQPTQTRVFQLDYAQADKLSPKIQEMVTKGVGSVRLDERTNKVIITDYPQKIEEIAQLITAFDTKTLQVLIDAQIVELKPKDTLDVGVDFDYWISKYLEIKLMQPSAALNPWFVGTPIIGQPQNMDHTGDYKIILDMLRSVADTKILSSPRIMALNNQEAKILVGEKLGYVVATTSQGASGQTVTSQDVRFVDSGIKLYVTPTISSSGFVTMKIRPEISSSEIKIVQSEGSDQSVPNTVTSEAETTVTVKDGVTVIIGGLKKDTRDKTKNRIPILGDIPFLGYLFGSTKDETSKTELIIFLTPHIMSGEEAFVDFAQKIPDDGVELSMVKGDIVTQRFRPAPKQEPAADPKEEALQEQLSQLNSQQQALAVAKTPEQVLKDEYSELVINKITSLTSVKPAKPVKGEVSMSFILDSGGALKAEPALISATNNDLVSAAAARIKKAAPFPPFPKELNKAEETFSITLAYK